MKLTHSLGVKITAIFLFALLSFAVIAGVGLIVMMLGQGYYWAEGELPADTALNAQGEALLYRQRTAIFVLTVLGFLTCSARSFSCSAAPAIAPAGKKLCLTCRTESRWTCMRSRHFSLGRWS